MTSLVASDAKPQEQVAREDFLQKSKAGMNTFSHWGRRCSPTAALDVISGSGCSALDTKASVPNDYDGARATEARTGL